MFEGEPWGYIDLDWEESLIVVRKDSNYGI